MSRGIPNKTLTHKLTDADKSMLRSASAQIRDLRRRNEILDAKVSTMELFAMVLNTQPAYRPQGGEEDMAWSINKRLREE